MLVNTQTTPVQPVRDPGLGPCLPAHREVVLSAGQRARCHDTPRAREPAAPRGKGDSSGAVMDLELGGDPGSWGAGGPG